jgi:hypothetical protein
VQEIHTESRGTGWLILTVAVAFILLPFLPLILSLAEKAAFGTDLTESFFGDIGLHDMLIWLRDCQAGTVLLFLFFQSSRVIGRVSRAGVFSTVDHADMRALVSTGPTVRRGAASL